MVLTSPRAYNFNCAPQSSQYLYTKLDWCKWPLAKCTTSLGHIAPSRFQNSILACWSVILKKLDKVTWYKHFKQFPSNFNVLLCKEVVISCRLVFIKAVYVGAKECLFLYPSKSSFLFLTIVILASMIFFHRGWFLTFLSHFPTSMSAVQM